LIVALIPLRNEAWIAAYSLRAALTWCDALCLVLHRCEDATPDLVAQIQAEHPGRVHVREFHGEWFDEARIRRIALALGRRKGGRWFVTIDADEVLAEPLAATIRSRIEALPGGAVLTVPWIQLWGSAEVYRTDAGSHGRRDMPLAFGDNQVEVAFPSEGYQLHRRTPCGTSWRQRTVTEAEQSDGGLLHLMRISWRRARARQAHRKMIETLRWPEHRGSASRIDAKYSAVVTAPEDITLAEVPAAWWPAGIDRGLIDADAPPWEEAACSELLARHGTEPFRGLDLFGVV